MGSASSACAPASAVNSAPDSVFISSSSATAASSSSSSTSSSATGSRAKRLMTSKPANCFPLGLSASGRSLSASFTSNQSSAAVDASSMRAREGGAGAAAAATAADSISNSASPAPPSAVSLALLPSPSSLERSKSACSDVVANARSTCAAVKPFARRLRSVAMPSGVAEATPPASPYSAPSSSSSSSACPRRAPRAARSCCSSRNVRRASSTICRIAADMLTEASWFARATFSRFRSRSRISLCRPSW